ncbi:MAG: 3-keto-disaccharide hydrolase [Daejeonella sp.]
MKYFSMIILCAALFSACGSSKNAMSGSKDGWQKLFDGKTTAGWHSYGKSFAGTNWKVVDGAIFLDAKNKTAGQGGDLVTNEEFENFHLKMEWKISKKGNSGIIFYVHEDPAKYPATYNTGLEMQVLDNDGHGDGKIIKHRAGDLYDLISSSKEPVHPVGEWNKVEIISNNGKLDLMMNGEKIVSTTLWDDNWKKMVAGSKFKSMPGFGIFKSGKIALQDHGNDVWYRNITIKRL